jgi:hypothetical protein
MNVKGHRCRVDIDGEGAISKNRETLYLGLGWYM